MKKTIYILSFLFGGFLLHSQEQNKDSIAATMLDEVVVDGYFGGLSKALNQQKNNQQDN